MSWTAPRRWDFRSWPLGGWCSGLCGRRSRATAADPTRWPPRWRAGEPPPAADPPQVWSLTQFYSVDFSHSRTGVKKGGFSTDAQSRFASDVLESVLGYPHRTWRCPCFSVVPEATHKASPRPLKGAVSAQKAIQGSKTETRELLGGTGEKCVSPLRGHWFCPPGKSVILNKKKETEINWVSGQTWSTRPFLFGYKINSFSSFWSADIQVALNCFLFSSSWMGMARRW